MIVANNTAPGVNPAPVVPGSSSAAEPPPRTDGQGGIPAVYHADYPYDRCACGEYAAFCCDECGARPGNGRWCDVCSEFVCDRCVRRSTSGFPVCAQCPLSDEVEA